MHLIREARQPVPAGAILTAIVGIEEHEGGKQTG
jgi:hypothetical protein